MTEPPITKMQIVAYILAAVALILLIAYGIPAMVEWATR